MSWSMESFLLDNTASEVPDVVQPLGNVDKRPGNVYFFFLSCSLNSKWQCLNL